jgi:hypothetical protein
LCRP